MTYSNIPATSTPARNFPVDTISTEDFPRSKTVLGTEGTATEWHAGNGAAANGARVAMSDEDRTLLGLTNATAAADETANTGLNGLLKGIFARLRGTLTVAPTAFGQTTRAYDYANGQTVTAGATSSASTAITASEVCLHNAGTVRVYVRTGAATPVATVNGQSLPLEPGEKLHIRITSGHLVAAIRDGASDAAIRILPVL